VYVRASAPRPQARLLEIGEGPATVDNFVAELQKFKTDPNELVTVRRVALGLVKDLPPNDDVSEVKALWQFARDAIRYVRDVRGIDTLQTPTVTLKLRQGDCDDKALLLASMLETIGYPTKFTVSATVPHGSYNHVFVETFVPRLGKWIPLESSVPGFPFGRALRTFEPARRFG
jgi:transglutaminase-like putative cysteine protease